MHSFDPWNHVEHIKSLLLHMPFRMKCVSPEIHDAGSRPHVLQKRKPEPISLVRGVLGLTPRMLQ